MINSKKIKDRLKYLGLRQSDVAEALGLKPPTANQKINNVRPLGLEEAEKLAELLKLDDSEFREFFFPNGCAKQVSTKKTALRVRVRRKKAAKETHPAEQGVGRRKV